MIYYKFKLTAQTEVVQEILIANRSSLTSDIQILQSTPQKKSKRFSKLEMQKFHSLVKIISFRSFIFNPHSNSASIRETDVNKI